MSGGPRVWNRGDIEAVAGFVSVPQPWLGRLLELLRYIEECEAREIPKPARKNANASAGGKARAANLTPTRRTEIASLAAKARWGKEPA